MDPTGLSILNSNPTRLPGPDLLHHLVTSPCELDALEHLSHASRTSYSYRDLHDAADDIARLITGALGNAGLSSPELVVPVLVPQSPLLYISLLAILKAGGAFCPLNIDAPPERIKFILKDVSAKVILVSSALASRIPSETGVSIICVDRIDKKTSSLADVEHRKPSPEDLAYVMYTSGSTGTPKGVGISHAAATQALLAHDRRVPEFSRFLQFAAPTFDVSVFEIFFPLFRGSTLITVRREDMLDDLPSVIREMDVDACELTPTVAGSLLRKRQSAPKLKLLLTIGEMLNAPVVEEFGGSEGKESMLWAITLQPALVSASSTGNIGTPLDTVSCFIIEPSSSPEDSSNFKILPVGEVGELAVGGYQLARGYLNRPEQTASAFISSPYGRVYRTGDRARLTAAGTLECLGRLASGQVKLRGQRIELGEIEQVVLKTPGCHGAVATVVDSNLVVFCAVDGDVAEGAIVTNCEKWLPRFMVPGELVMMHEFPRLPSGKVDTKTLKSDLSDRKLADLSNEDATDEGDRDILRVVSDTLGLRASKSMTLASAGVDSLAAIRLASCLRIAGFKTSAPELLKLRTISDLCSTLREQPSTEPLDDEPLNISLLADLDQILSYHPALQNMAAQIIDILPCTPLQSAMLAETAQNPEAYGNEMQLQTSPGVAPQDISDAFQQLAHGNEILRTGFVQWRGGQVAVLVNAIDPVNIQIVQGLQRGFVSTSQDLLAPFRVQIEASENGSGTRLLIQAHHAVYDGWSMDMILSDISALLSLAPPPPRPQFRDIVKFHAGSSRKEADDSARTFWSQHLLGWNKSPFPKLGARSSGADEIKTAKDTLDVAPVVVREATQKRDFSAQVLFQSALALVWSGIVGEQDVVLGSVTSGRTIPVDGIERIFGPCIASLPIRVDFSSMSASTDVLRNLQASNRAIMEHCTLPLAEIKKLAGLQPAESLYDVLFVYQESLDTKEKETQLVKEVDHLDRLETKLLLEIEPRASDYALQTTYHSSSFPPEFVTYFMQQFKSIFQKLVDNPEDSIQSAKGSLPFGLSIHNEDLEGFQGTPDLAVGVEAIAKRLPTANALSFNMSSQSSAPRITSLSYQELNAAANQTAHFLSSFTVNIGEVVAIIMDKSPLLYTSILGIVKAGCAYLPILPTTPVARVREIFRQARVKHCLVDDASHSTFSSVEAICFLNIEAKSLQSYSDSNMDIPPDPKRLAYVIYTSGTTGVPKGVAVTQENIVSNIAHLRSIYPASLERQPHFLQACSQAFDVSVFEIFFAWHAGMCLCAATNDVLFEDLENSIRQLDITHLSLTPTVASLIDPAKVPGVEFLVTAGEPMTLSVLNRWGDRLWQGYGPSETTNICSVKRMALGENIEHLGWVFPNTSVFVMSPSSLEIVPVGWVGEFCFGGDQVAQGYLNEPRLTAEKFVQHSRFGRIYRSGDMGRMLPDGSLVILGRIDEQIKLRGQRIEATEINSIMTSTGLAESAVTMSVRRRTGAPDQLASFYLPPRVNAEFKPLEIEPEANRMLFATLQSRVPSYMVPSYLIPVSQIPLSSSGKVDRRRLQATFEELPQDYMESASYTTQSLEDDAGWTEMESAIADVISHSTKTARADIGRWTPFAALGVDSISAIGIARALSSDLGARIPISAILQNPSVAQLGNSLEKNEKEAKGEVEHPVSDTFAATVADEVRRAFTQDPGSIEDILPCTPLQEAMLSQGRGSYYNKILLRLRIQAADMRTYWDEMSRRHGILRTCFVTTKNVAHPIAQVVLRNWTIAWKTFDVHVPSLAGAAHEHLKTLPEPLDSELPPVSFAFIRYKGSTFFSLICHHALYDGVAMEILWREVEALANGRTLLPPVPYRPFIQKALSLPADTDAFWADQFRGFRPSTLFSRLAGSDINQCTHITSLDMSYGEAQERLRSLGVSLLSACQTAWANVVAVSCDGPDVAFGNVVSGRALDLDGLDRLVAPCFNTIPIRKDLSRSSQNIEVLRYFQQLNTQLLRYQFTSLRRVQKVANCLRRGLFDTLLLLQQPLQDMDESVWTLEEDAGNMDIPLVCEVVPCPNLNSIVVNVHYDIGIVSGDVATTMADIFKHVFRRLLDLPFASPADRSTLPPSLKLGLKDLVRRREKPENADQQRFDAENWTDTERTIQEVISELSGVPQAKVSRHTSIFHLGLDSINAVQVASMLRQRGFKLSASDVLECSNCAKLARRMLHDPERHSGTQSFDLYKFARDVSTQVNRKAPIGQVEAILPCTAVQSAMLVSFIQSQGHNYLNMITYQIDDSIEMGDLAEAWRTLQRRHPMLRTGFVSVSHKDSTFAMVRQPAASIDAPVACIDSGSFGTFDLQQWQKDARETFLLNPQVPPWQVALVDNGGRTMMSILMHHALYDAQSLDEMLDGLWSLLRRKECSFSRVEPALAEILSRSLKGQEEARMFWEKHAGNSVVNKFPLMTPLREAKASLLTHEATSSIPFKLLREATQSLGASVQAVLQAAWARVLASYLGESSVVFGATMSGRTTDETQAASFPCITTVPIVAVNTESNRGLVQNMMEYNTELHKHQFAPLSHVQKWLGHPGTPVFDTLVVYQKRNGSGAVAGPWKLVKDEAVVEYAVSLEVEPMDNDDVRLCITFAGDVLPTEQARLLIRQFDAILGHLVREPDGNERDLYKKRPDIFAITPAAIPNMTAPVEFLHQFVERRAATHPDSTALEFVSGYDNRSVAKRTWSYKDLDLIGNRAANLLQESTSPGDIVAIHFQKCAEAYFSILGILKAGCAFVALDPNAPKARKAFILGDSQAKCLLADGESTLDFEVSTKLLRISEESLQTYPDSRPDLGDSFTPANTCYCLYTSGTTGTPKGCEITHENAVQAMMAFQDLFSGHWAEDSRWLQFAALHFDVSVLEQYWSWSVGITVVAAPRDLILDDLIGSINTLGVTHIDLTPSLARLTHPDEMPSLCKGVFITGGEQLKQEILDAWGSKAVIYNAYGPTEATIGVTMYPRVPVNGRPSNIGRQFLNVGSYVFRPGTEIPVLRGGVGELCVSGKLVGKGYLNRPELTDERFPTLAEFEERIYRTGDLVRILHDGCFDFLGRADDQVKLRGQRLEIGEINHAIRTGAPDVQDAATIVVRQESSGKDVLVSFLVGESNGSPSLSVLPDTNGLAITARAACLERLPGYMVPTYFLRLPYIPLSPNNKVEAKELKALFESLSHEQLMKVSAAGMPSADSRLDRLALQNIVRILSGFSNVPEESLSPSTSIFDVGVDSITALQLSTQLRTAGFEAASPATLLRCPIIADLVRALSTDTGTTPHADLVREAKQTIQACHHRYRPLVCRELGVGLGDIEYIAPCSPLQQGIISKTVTEETSGAYFNSFELQLDGGASVDRTRQAWSRLVESHAVLRSAFVNTSDGHVQVALKRKTPWQECSAKAKDEVVSILEQTRRDWISRNNHHILDPIQLILVHGPDCERVIIHIFHALYDGNSFELMNQHAAALYNNTQPRTGPSFIEALAHGPLWRHDHCQQFWVEYLRGWAFSQIPTLPHSSVGTGAVSSTRTVSLDLFEKMRTQQNVTLQSVVLAVWAFVLQKHLASKLTIGVIVAGRSIDVPNVEHTIGPLFNTVPFFNNMQGYTWASLIRECHKFSTSILPFQHVPLKSIQKWCTGGRPLFDNLFAFQLEQPGPDGEDVPWTVVDTPSHPDYPLAFEATRTRTGELRLSLVAQSQVADSTLLEYMLDQIEDAVATAEAEALLDALAVHDDLGDEAGVELTDAANSSVTPDHFIWTEQALVIRQEVATLTDVPVDDVNTTTTMLELGLDSIDAIKLSTRLKRNGIQLSASQIMRHQTMLRLVQETESTEPERTPRPANDHRLEEIREKLHVQVPNAGIDSNKVESVSPPTALQESMVAGMVQSGFEWYFNHDVLEVADGVDMERLEEAWGTVVKQSPILRTGFVEVADASLDMAYCQVVFRDNFPRIKTVALSDLSGLRRITSDATQLAAQGNGVDNLLQITFAVLGQRRFAILSVAHAMYDGWSLSLMYQDLEAAYEGRVESRPSADSFVSRILASKTDEAQEFWGNYLDGLSPSILAGNRPPMETTPDGLFRREITSRKTLSEATDFCKKKAISLQVLCLACWALVVAEQTQSLDVVFGLVLSGRDFEGAEEVMFPTMNTVAMRCVLHGSISGFLKYLEETMADIRDFQAFPLRKAQAAAKLASAEMFNSLFLFQKSSEAASSSSRLLHSIDGSSAVDYPVCVEAEPSGDQLIWRIACQAQFFSQEETHGLIKKLDRVLRFVFESETADVLSFHGDDVSICGMPAVAFNEAPPVDPMDTTAQESDNDEHWGETGIAIRDVLSQVSDVPIGSIKSSSTLYHLGLDSISAIKVSILLRKKAIHLKPRELVTSASILEMASQARLTDEFEQQSQTLPAWTPPPDVDVDKQLKECDLPDDAIEAVLPATPMQVYMLTAWQNSEGSVFYPEFCYRIDGDVDVAQVHDAWQSLNSQIPMLRARFVATESKELPWLQAIVKDEAILSGRVSQPLVDLSITKDVVDQTLMLRLRIHHALYDGVSLPAIISQLCSLLNNDNAGRSERDISQWARQSIRPTLKDAQASRRAFWTNYLQQGIRTSHSVSPSPGGQSRTSYLEESAVHDISQLRKVASQHGTSLQSLFLAACAKSIAKQTTGNSSSVIFGIYLANRTTEHDSPPLVYPTLNLVPLKVELGHDESLATVAKTIQNDIHAISSDGRADVGLWEISSWTGVKVDSFVNFLSLPDEQDSSPRAVALAPVHDAGAPSASNYELATLLAQPWLQRNAVRDAFPVG
ncbi:Hydroxamate-type ferrichrome siderophore peptide synthetase [Tolypocladium ophioglossoides CBS 100239]|uniref:Hydroxamate-type ferrichrome siderophore peptide synthetase n=1 Tax=Tolypocladium ophioglossoides (strain CBS 100239) TaxID=1163406 RepID=A0A0L0NF15_TOLOC|nr:Hydroxamate-type ferrichrome siderophore peptide synthetase [Tolypocladium ophioglossoides CBS 100239]